ncbi:MAG: type II toxin-antitoxin system HicA family toxin [Anaerolineae bacterium]|nr:type II toxin-antitoxin system HicA family toxin [Anaerolineae bacterium]
MPKLRRLNGPAVINIFEQFGFAVIRIKGGHHIMRRTVDGQAQTLNVPVHGTQAIPIGTLHSIYRDGCRYIPAQQLGPFFYAD